MPTMRDGLRYALLLIAGFVAVLFIISFTAYSLTTYGSIRSIVGDIAAQPEQAASLHNQYSDMQNYFTQGKGDTFTYHFGSLPLSVDRSQVSGMSEKQTTDLVMDIYASNLYIVKYNTGIMGKVGSFIGSSGNGMYTIVTALLGIVLLVAGAAALLPRWTGPLPLKLRDAGKVLVIFCAVAFVIFMLAPSIAKSIVWDSIPNSDSGRDILHVVESKITASLLFNTLLMAILGIAMYAAGYFLDARSQTGAPMLKHAAVRAQSGHGDIGPKHKGL